MSRRIEDACREVGEIAGLCPPAVNFEHHVAISLYILAVQAGRIAHALERIADGPLDGERLLEEYRREESTPEEYDDLPEER